MTTAKTDKSKEIVDKNKKGAQPPLSSEEIPGLAPASRDFNAISINLSIFSLLVALVFSYFAYFSHQIAVVRSEIISKILEINAIASPHRMSFMTLAGPYEYNYLKRKEILLSEFQKIEQELQDQGLDPAKKAAYGKKLQEILTVISYSFPFKRMIDIDKHGNWIYDPNNYESIQSSDNLSTNIPPYKRLGMPSNYNTIFLKQQIDEVNHIHSSFTLYLKDNKRNIAEALALSNGIKDDYNRERLRLYLDGLIEYLENHHRLMIPLGLIIVRNDYLVKKANLFVFCILCCLMAVNFFSGVILPLFEERLRSNKLLWAVAFVSFAVGLFVLFWIALYSLH